MHKDQLSYYVAFSLYVMYNIRCKLSCMHSFLIHKVPKFKINAGKIKLMLLTKSAVL